jgi:glucose dehydrogenase
MKAGIDNGFTTGAFSLSSPPIVYKNLVITGARVQESPSLGFAGDTRAWDVHTGKLVWQFHSVARPGETGSDTWKGDDWKARSGTNVWGLMSLDTQLGIVYLPYGSPSYDFYGADRAGANLFGNTLVALDAATGKLKWYFQTVHHDIWDYDLESAPILFDLTRNKTKIPALAVTSKTGLVFILDRRTGKPLYDVQERAVPQSEVPGEHSWPTEPFPEKPAPLSRMTFSPDDIAKVTPEHEKFCKELLASDGGMAYGGPFNPYGSKTTINFPGTLGATNWHGGSFDPTLGYLFYNTLDLADVGKVQKSPEGSKTVYNRNGYGRFWNPDNYWPCQAPPWGEMVAIDVNTGEYAWRVPLGIVPELEEKGVHNTGTMNMGGSAATAGGLVFIGATNDRHFRAFDSKSGKVLWDKQLEAGAYASPVVYQGKDGKEYVAIVAAGGGYYDRQNGDSVVAFALP